MSEPGLNTPLNEWLHLLEQRHPNAIDLGLERLAQVAERLNLPKPSARLVTVAGTNGKGSTVAMISAMAQAAGIKVGCYTSPHFLRYNERVTLQGEVVSDEALVRAFSAIEAARGDISLTYFEFGTLAAFMILEAADLDLWVLEVGLGGRLDAVNLFDPDVAVLTTVAMDHEAYLGHSLDAIGREKAGIFRTGRPAVLGSRDLPASVATHADGVGAEVYRLGSDHDYHMDNQAWHWRGLSHGGDAVTLRHLPVPHLHHDNASTAIQALLLTGLPVSPEAIASGLEQVAITGRMQRLGRWCLDVAHNPHAANHLSNVVKRSDQQHGQRKRGLVIGMMADKDIEHTVASLSEVALFAWAIPLPLERAIDPQSLSDIMSSYLPVRQLTNPLDAAEAFGAAAQALTDGELDEVLVCGSFFTVAAALTWLDQHPEACL